MSSAVDRISEAVANIRSGVSLEEEIATLDVEELAEQFGVSFDTMRDRLRRALGDSYVFRLGKKWVIRKRSFLDFLLKAERGDQRDQL